MITLMQRVSHGDLKVIYGDKAYISRKNVQFIHDLGVYPVIEPESSSSVNTRGYQGCGQLMSGCRADPEEWKKKHQYEGRSLVETMFNMMKLSYGIGLCSRGLKER